MTKIEKKIPEYVLSTKGEWKFALVVPSSAFWQGLIMMVEKYEANPKDLWDCVVALLKGEILVPYGKSHHMLKGNMKGQFDLHIPNKTKSKRNDWLLIYEWNTILSNDSEIVGTITFKSLQLNDTGTHKSTRVKGETIMRYTLKQRVQGGYRKTEYEIKASALPKLFAYAKRVKAEVFDVEDNLVDIETKGND